MREEGEWKGDGVVGGDRRLEIDGRTMPCGEKTWQTPEYGKGKRRVGARAAAGLKPDLPRGGRHDGGGDAGGWAGSPLAVRWGEGEGIDGERDDYDSVRAVRGVRDRTGAEERLMRNSRTSSGTFYLAE